MTFPCTEFFQTFSRFSRACGNPASNIKAHFNFHFSFFIYISRYWYLSLKIEHGFLKHYAPNHMLAPKDNRGIIKKFVCPKFNQVIYTICMANIMIPAQTVLQIFCSQGPLWIQFLSLKRGIIQSNVHRIIIYIIYTKCMPNIMILAPVLFTRLLYYTMCQNWKRKKIQPNIYRILPIVNQVICTLHTICMQNMILAQAVLQILC